MEERARQEEIERNRRYFESTNQTSFSKKPMDENTIGRRVMKTQNGMPVPHAQKDELLQVEHGFGKRTAKATDQELYNRIPKGDYT